jgi:SET domain
MAIQHEGRMLDYLLLGPVRFVNHGCDPNAKFAWSRRRRGIKVVARRPIDAGEEVTVSYGQDYFGQRNRSCRCATCEKKCRNGWRRRKLGGLCDKISPPNRKSSGTAVVLHDMTPRNYHIPVAPLAHQGLYPGHCTLPAIARIPHASTRGDLALPK